jgi:hypothetical protein
MSGALLSLPSMYPEILALAGISLYLSIVCITMSNNCLRVNLKSEAATLYNTIGAFAKCFHLFLFLKCNVRSIMECSVHVSRDPCLSRDQLVFVHSITTSNDCIRVNLRSEATTLYNTMGTFAKCFHLFLCVP